jgi:uncharacterized protein YcfJ
MLKRSSILIITISLAGCSYFEENPRVGYGVAGAATGAATGAIIGSAIDGGSPGVGAAIGAGAGALAGVAWGAHLEEQRKAELAQIDTEIRINQLEIKSQDRELQDLQQRVLDDSQRGAPDDSRARKIYDGVTVGDPFR